MDLDADIPLLHRIQRDLTRDQALIRRSRQHMDDILRRLQKTKQVIHQACAHINTLSPVIVGGMDRDER
jgi:hypothetical protein